MSNSATDPRPTVYIIQTKLTGKILAVYDNLEAAKEDLKLSGNDRLNYLNIVERLVNK